MEALLFASIFTGITVATKRVVLYYYRKKIKENQDLISIAKLDEQLWKIFSKYIRSKDADWKGYITCFTCPTTDDWRTFDAGHYLPQALGISVLKFYEKNVHPQCINCNRLKQGNYKEYRNRLIVKYGLGIIEELTSLRQSPPLTVLDYQKKIAYYSNWLKQNPR